MFETLRLLTATEHQRDLVQTRLAQALRDKDEALRDVDYWRTTADRNRGESRALEARITMMERAHAMEVLRLRAAAHPLTKQPPNIDGADPTEARFAMIEIDS